tara:strand:+ start:1075 stop:1317 length:243 start_codon:yes stop_codon:yes gene_type:complete
MFKSLQNKDEIADSTKLENNSLNKVDKKVEKELKQKAKPINPKMIFENLKTKKSISNSKFRKPTPDGEGKNMKIITIEDY